MHEEANAAHRPSRDADSRRRWHTPQGGREAGLEDSAGSGPPREVKVLTILVVDDDEPTGESIEMVLQEAGYEVVRAANGREALASARERWPALLLTDHMMPGMSGVALVEAMQAMADAEEWPMPPVLLLTAAYWPPHVEDERISVVLGKPFDVEQLERTVARLLSEVQGEAKSSSHGVQDG